MNLFGSDGGRPVSRRRWLAAAALVAASPFAAAQAQAPATPVVLVVGDSLSAEYGLKRGSGWVPLLQQRLKQENIAARVVNASISGDTSAGGRSRLSSLLTRHQPTHVVIELGANDAMRGLPLATTEANLSTMVQAAQSAGAKVLLVGIQLPPNYGREYSERLLAMYEQLAKSDKAALVPFLLKGVADVADAPRLFQPDGIHPNEDAQPQMLANVWPELRKLLVTK